ncbi:MAG: NADP-dependent 3-hydroxy acid dehydrogenase YdfG [Cyclobacteriaceae bacterium]
MLVNNAGVFFQGEISTEEQGKLEFMMNTNLYSAYHLTRGVVTGMKDQKSGDIFVRVLTQVEALTARRSKVLREELKSFAMVISVLPGATYTASWDGIDLLKDRFIKPEDVAEAIWSAYSLSKNSVIEDLTIRPQFGDI